MLFLGDFRRGQTVRFTWNSAGSSGQSITRSTNGTISVYKDGNTTQFTTGVTDNEDYDGLTGVHEVSIDTSSGYGIGDYYVILSAATIDTQTVNVSLAHFSIENRFTGEIRAGTTSTHSASTITLAAETAPGLNFFTGCSVLVTSGTGVDQVRTVSGSTNANPPVLTLNRNWAVTPSGSITYKVFPGEQGATTAEIGAGALTAGVSSQASQDVILTTALTEAYAADGATMTVAQALYMIRSFLFEASVSSTTLTAKKIDGSTSAMTFTLSDASNPVSITRAT